jgi:hypothetical protein
MNFQGTDATNTSYWTQDILTVDPDITFQNTTLAIKSLWSLSEDGKTLTVNTHFTSSLGELDQKWFLPNNEMLLVPIARRTFWDQRSPHNKSHKGEFQL